MQLHLYNTALHLEPRQLLKLRGGRGVRVTCQAGLLWLTQEGVARDDFLVPGDSRLLETAGTVLIEAICRSRAVLAFSAKQTATRLRLMPA